MKKVIVIAAFSLCLIAWSAEDNFLINLTQKFEEYKKNNPQVSVHLLFNQDKYVGGDTAYFKAYFVNDQFLPVSGKQILELEVVDQTGMIIQKQSFRVTEGKSENQIILSKDIQPGKYRFVAFSEWMRNFDESFFFSKEFLLAGRYELSSEKKLTTSLISIFPEGGHLIAGTVNRAIIKSSPLARVMIKNSGGENVVGVTLDKNGSGDVRFTPMTGQFMELEENGQKFSLDNKIENDGLALQVTPSTILQEPQEVQLSAPLGSTLLNQDLYLVVTSHNKIFFTSTIRFQGKEALQLNIPTQSLNSGLNQLFVFDSNGNIKAERVFWKRNREMIAAIIPAKETSANRELVTLDILLTDDRGAAISAEGVISALNKNLFAKSMAPSLDQELLLSELPQLRQLINPTGLTNEEWKAHSDYYLIPMKWQRIPWKAILENGIKQPMYKFKNSMSLNGSGVYQEAQKPLPDSTLIMIYLQKHMMGYELYTKGGKFELPFMYDFWGTDQVFYTVEGFGRSIVEDAVLKLNGTQIAPSKELVLKQTDSIEFYGDYKFKKDLMDQSFGFYAKSKDNNTGERFNPNIEFEDELGGADFSVNAQEYLVFPTMEEMIREILPFVQHRKRGDKVTVRLILLEGTLNSVPKSEPLFIIDGVMSKNTELFLSLKPADILTVKVVRDRAKLRQLGAIGGNGVIFVQTKNSLADKLIEKGNLLTVQGLSKPIDFRSSDYSKSSDQRVPDFRSTLYWNPTVKTGSNGRATVRFFASDDVGPVIIKFQGLTAEGLPFSTEKEINVVFQKTKN